MDIKSFVFQPPKHPVKLEDHPNEVIWIPVYSSGIAETLMFKTQHFQTENPVGSFSWNNSPNSQLPLPGGFNGSILSASQRKGQAKRNFNLLISSKEQNPSKNTESPQKANPHKSGLSNFFNVPKFVPPKIKAEEISFTDENLNELSRTHLANAVDLDQKYCLKTNNLRKQNSSISSKNSLPQSNKRLFNLFQAEEIYKSEDLDQNSPEKSPEKNEENIKNKGNGMEINNEYKMPDPKGMRPTVKMSENEGFSQKMIKKVPNGILGTRTRATKKDIELFIDVPNELNEEEKDMRQSIASSRKAENLSKAQMPKSMRNYGASYSMHSNMNKTNGKCQTERAFRLLSPQEESKKISSTLESHPSTTPMPRKFTIETISPHLRISHHIPCMLLKPDRPADSVIIFFHGNGEDIVTAKYLASLISLQFRIYVLIVEYPGYSFYKGREPSERAVFQDSEAVYDFLTSNLGFEEVKIIILGRSLGSGPSCHLGTVRNPGAILLVSAFTSIRAVAEKVMRFSLQYFVKDQFCNLEKIGKIRSPVFILHGKVDEMVPVAQAHQLFNKANRAELVVAEKMSHSAMSFYDDFLHPISSFLITIGFPQHFMKMRNLVFPKTLFKNPNPKK